MDTVAVDCLILGGGLSGLWLLNTLRCKGYSTLLLHDGHELGGIQSLNSAGMIHGGGRVGLSRLSREEQLADMPGQWDNCLRGSGRLDLRDVRILSPDQTLWCPGDIRSRATLALVAANLAGHVKRLPSSHFPPPLHAPGFQGDAWSVNWPVIDSLSLLNVLSRPYADCIYQAGQQDVHIQTDDLHMTRAVFVRKGKVQLRIHPRQVFLTAGAGNAALLQDLGINRPLMRRRPIHMVCIQHPDLPVFYGHCHIRERQSRLTITTHDSPQGRLWYIAGAVAESGVNRDETLQVQAVKDALRTLLPWLSLKGARYRSFLIDRIYPLDAPPWEPVRACVERFANNWLVWPTRLVLAPNAAHRILNGLEELRFAPSLPQPETLPMARPRLGAPLWEKLLA